MTRPTTTGIYELRAIGWVESTLVDSERAAKQGHEAAQQAWLVLDAAFREAFRDLRPGCDVIVLTWLIGTSCQPCS